jgi:hypothetical protein
MAPAYSTLYPRTGFNLGKSSSKARIIFHRLLTTVCSSTWLRTREVNKLPD